MTRTEQTISDQQKSIVNFGRALQASRDVMMDAYSAAEEGTAAREILQKHLIEIGKLQEQAA